MTRSVSLHLAALCLSFLGGCAYDNDGAQHIDKDAEVDPAQDTIDTDATLTPDQGGIGLFIEYRAGGTWSIRVTCDSETSGYLCGWTVYAQTLDGSKIQSSAEEDLESEDKLTTSSDGVVLLETVTGSDLDGAEFRVEPGTAVGFDVWLEGLADPHRYVYWVSEGALNRGMPVPSFDLTPTQP